MKTANPDRTIMALDVGQRRIGVAVARLDARLATPLLTLTHTAIESTIQHLHDLVIEQAAVALVVGLPRGLDGQSTHQTSAVESFVAQLKSHLSLPIFWQDEAVTSVKAEEELSARRRPYTKDDIDALAATYILEDFLREHPGELPA